MFIRNYRSSDCKEIVELFIHTVHTVNAKDYTQEQLDAWTAESIDFNKWDQSLQGHYAVVAVQDGIIVGFGDIDESGYLDRLYVHAQYQGRGIGSALCDELEHAVQSKVITHASISAKPFFEGRGYHVLKEQVVTRKNVLLKNFVMVKKR